MSDGSNQTSDGVQSTEAGSPRSMAVMRTSEGGGGRRHHSGHSHPHRAPLRQSMSSRWRSALTTDFSGTGEGPLASALFGVVTVALLFAGSAWPRSLGDVSTQIASVPLVFLVVRRLAASPGPNALSSRFVRLLPLAAIAIPLLQVVPLPPALWTALPGREILVQTLELLHRDLPFQTLALSPSMAWRAALFTVPAVAVFYATALLSTEMRLRLVAAIGCFALLNILFAMAQRFYGAESWWDLYGTVSPTSMTGLFRSKNHYPALLYTALPLVVTALFVAGQRLGARPWVMMTVTIGVTVALLIGVLLSRSRAGFVLALVAVAWSFRLMIARETHLSRRWLVPAGAAVLVTLVLLEPQMEQLLLRFESSPVDDYRWVIAARAWQAFLMFLPFGSGLGTFVPIYQRFETIDTLPTNTFVNFAHDDFLQIAVEAGIPGVAASAAYLGWFLWTFVRLRRLPNLMPSVLLGQAASVSAFLLLAHSTIEYPLRTGALAVVFAVCNALMLVRSNEPPLPAKPTADDTRSARSHRRHRSRTSHRPTLERQSEPADEGSAANPAHEPTSTGTVR